MKKIPLVLSGVVLALLAACSTEQLTGTAYYALQGEARDDCNKLLYAERAACLQRNSASYETYKKQRDEVNARR